VAIAVSTDPLLTGVHGGPEAINLGGIGIIPEPLAVLTALAPVLARQQAASGLNAG
jgi:hypothetical protein